MIPCTNMKVPIGNGWIIGVKPHGIRSNYRNNANQERSLNDINNYTELSVKQNDFRGLYYICSSISLCSIDKEEGFNVTQDRKAQLCSGIGCETTKLWYADVEGVLSEWHIKIN